MTSQRKSFFATLVFIGFVLTSVFGIVAMINMDGHSQGTCIADMAAAAKGVSCPQNPGQSVSFHIDLFKGFSTAVVGNFNLLFFFAVGAFIVFASIRLLKRNHYLKHIPLLQRDLFTNQPIHLFKKPYLAWLALTEHEPALMKEHCANQW